MSGFSERRNQDLIKLNELVKSTNGKVQILSKSGNPVSTIVIELNYPTVVNSNYPTEICNKTKITISLSSKYPFTEPSVSFDKPIVFHPNVYDSGRICFGTKWLPTQGLDLLIKRVIKIITFEPDILNEASPANVKALNWYRSVIKKFPTKFPTTKLQSGNETNKPSMSWNNLK